MNKAQRTRINDAQAAVSVAISNVRTQLETMDEMETQEKENFYNHPDSVAEREALENALNALDDVYREVATDEQDKYDNLTEGLQQSERGQAYEANAQSFESAADDVGTVVNELCNITCADENALAAVLDSADELLDVEEA